MSQRGNIGDFEPVNPDDFPEINPKVFEMLAPIQTSLRDVVRLLHGKLGPFNLNWEILEKDLISGSPTVLTLETLNGAPLGAVLLLVDGHKVKEWGVRILDEDRLEVTLVVATLPAPTTALPTRIAVLGS